MAYDTAGIWAVTALAAVPLLLVFLRTFNHLVYGSKTGLPPGMMGWFWMGESFEFVRCFTKNRPDWFINRLVARYGKLPAYKSHLFGRPSVLLTSSELINFACNRHDLFENDWPYGEKLMGEDALPVTMGVTHKKLRSLVLAAISGVACRSSQLPGVERATKATLAKWATGHKFKLVDATRQLQVRIMASMSSDFLEAYLLFRWAWQALTRGCCQLVLEDLAETFLSITDLEDIKLIDRVYNAMVKGFRASFPFYFPGSTFYNAVKARKKLCQLVQSLIDKRRVRKDGQSHDVLDYMMNSKDEMGNPMTDRAIQHNMTSFILSSYESTVITMFWSTYHLAKNPEVLMELRAEYARAAATKKGEFFTLDEVSSLKFTNQVIHEVLRVTSLSPLAFRKAFANVEHNGVLFPEGWRALLWFRASHMDPLNYEDPEKFLPHRWDPENYAQAKAHFFAFGAGHRHCPGSQISKMWVAVFLYHLVHGYKFELVNPTCNVIHMPHPMPIDKGEIIITPR